MINITLNLEIKKNKEKLKLKDKQSILYTLINMYGEYGKLLHESTNNIKTGFSFFIPNKENKIHINISENRFDGLQLKYFLKQNLKKELKVSNDIIVKYDNYKIRKLPNKLLLEKDILETLSPIYINDTNNHGVYNYDKEINNENIDNIRDKILKNINNYANENLTTEDIIIIPTFKTRLLTGFNEKHAWSAYYIQIIFKPNGENFEKILKVKKILLTNFYKSSYTGYFILK